MKSNLIAVLLALIASAQAQSAAKVAVFRNADVGKEYIFDHTTERTYYNASSFCESLNATLIKIRSSKENNFITENMENLAFRHYFYLGVVPVNMTAFIGIRPTKFTDGTEVEYYNCENNSYDACSSTYYGCAVLVVWYNGNWRPDDCNTSFGNFALCERPLPVEGIVEPLVEKWNTTLQEVDQLIKDKDKNMMRMINENAKLRENITHVTIENSKLQEKLNEREQVSRRRELYLLSHLKNFIEDMAKIKNSN